MPFLFFFLLFIYLLLWIFFVCYVCSKIFKYLIFNNIILTECYFIPVFYAFYGNIHFCFKISESREDKGIQSACILSVMMLFWFALYFVNQHQKGFLLVLIFSLISTFHPFREIVKKSSVWFHKFIRTVCTKLPYVFPRTYGRIEKTSGWFSALPLKTSRNFPYFTSKQPKLLFVC